MRRLLVAGACLVAVGLGIGIGVVACSGSNDNAQPTMSASAWRKRVNAICAGIGREVKAIKPPRSENEIADFVAAAIPLWDRERHEIRALELPTGMETEAQDFLTNLDYLTAALLEIGIATQQYDGLRRSEATKKLRAAARGIKLRSQVLGLPACSRQRIP